MATLDWHAEAAFTGARRSADEKAAKVRARETKAAVSEALQLEEGEQLWGFVIWRPKVT